MSLCACCQPNAQVRTQIPMIYYSAIHNEPYRINSERFCQNDKMCKKYGYCNGKCVNDITYHSKPMDTLPKEYLKILRDYDITEDMRIKMFAYVIN
jgi:hypothetical protein